MTRDVLTPDVFDLPGQIMETCLVQNSFLLCVINFPWTNEREKRFFGLQVIVETDFVFFSLRNCKTRLL